MGRSIAANAFSFLIVALIALGGLVAWAQTQFRDPGPLVKDTVIEVPKGANLGGVSEELLKIGAISHAQIFRIGAKYTDRANRLKFGEYVLPAGVSMDEILDILVQGKSIQYFVTLPEGMYISEIVARINAASDLTGVIENLPPEGMLAPNTYSFQRGDTRQSVVDRMLAAQMTILEEAWAGRASDLPLKSKEELLIMASIVESEAGGAGEWGLVASVFYNRMNANIRLQADATIRYGLTDGKERLRRGLRESELARVTPYNTYQIDGLTPTPISNPGRDAIMATANPEVSKFYYFVLDGSGGHAFASNLREHNNNVAAWRKIERARASE
ncbi:MAG: endolytic transglycosylase MltG [Paracoccaceae bacterium]